jgi:peptidyl-prolyl cis-trans isomerase B (cyclophilin B)
VSSKREKELARLRAERQAARKAAEAARRKQRTTAVAIGLALLLAIGAVFAVVVTQDGDDDTPQGASCTWNPTSQPASKPVSLPSAEPAATPTTATLATNRGAISFTLNSTAPCAASSLASLASQGFYDDTPCHRLTTSGLFVLQCGDPTGTGTGGPGYQFAEEALDGATYTRGTVAMAKGTAKGTTGSQFFIVYKDSDTPLPAEYTPLGQVTSGLDVVDAIAKAGATTDAKTGNSAPKQPVTIATLRTSTVASPLPTASVPAS